MRMSSETELERKPWESERASFIIVFIRVSETSYYILKRDKR